MKLKLPIRANEKEKICRTRKDLKNEIFRVLSNRVETRKNPKFPNGAPRWCPRRVFTKKYAISGNPETAYLRGLCWSE